MPEAFSGQLRRLPPGNYRLHDVGRQEGQREETTDVAFVTTISSSDRTHRRDRACGKLFNPFACLDETCKQLTLETVVDRDALNSGQFAAYGGYARLNKIFDGKMEKVLQDLHEQVWKESA